MLLICLVLLTVTWICRVYSFVLRSGLSYFRILTICLLLVYFVSAAGCHCFDYNVIKSRYQEKAALPTSVLMFPKEINGHSNVGLHSFKKQTSESAFCQPLNNPRMGFSVLYKSRKFKSTILKPETTMFSKGLLTVSGCLFCGSWELRC